MTSNQILDQIHAFPKLLAVGSDDTLNSHHSYEILQALAGHSEHVKAVNQEYGQLSKEDKTFRGHSSSDLAEAFRQYASQRLDQPMSQKYKIPAGSSISTGRVTSLATGVGSVASIASLQDNEAVRLLSIGQYSWSALLRELNWARILYAIVWIVLGLTLLFFGLASVFWLDKLDFSNRNHANAPGLLSSLPVLAKDSPKGNRRRRRAPLLAGGVGGILVGFLFFSYLVSVIHNAVCVNQNRTALPPGAFFALWLSTGLLGGVVGGHFAILSRSMIALLGGTCLTIIITAVFAIRPLLVRIILTVLFSVFFLVPQIQPRARGLQLLLINFCTSTIGSVTFLNGVALVSPSIAPSSGWLDLWTLLFVQDKANERDAILSAWHSSVFKGFIAASTLGTVIGFLFELVLHRTCGSNPDAEWNEYLGTYTQHMESANVSAAKPYDGPNLNAESMTSRAGMFIPAPSAWQKMVDFFDSDHSRPAHYGNLSGDDSYNATTSNPRRTSPLAEKIRNKRSIRSTTSGGRQPARFTPLSKHDDDDDFDETSSVDSDVDEK